MLLIAFPLHLVATLKALPSTSACRSFCVLPCVLRLGFLVVLFRFCAQLCCTFSRYELLPLTRKGISMAKRITGKRKAQLAGIAVSYVCSDLFRKFQNEHGFAMPDLMTTAYVIGESMNGNRSAWRRTAPKNEIAAFFWEALAFRSGWKVTIAGMIYRSGALRDCSIDSQLADQLDNLAIVIAKNSRHISLCCKPYYDQLLSR